MEIFKWILVRLLEPIYFSLFLIYGKNLKSKRILFTIIMMFEFVMLTDIIEFNVLFQFLYTFMTFINLKVLYKEKAQITDIFLFAAASLILIAISAICFIIISITFKNIYIALILKTILMFLFIYIFKGNINKTYQKFYKYWNRHNNPKVMKSLTLRNISIIIFNVMFWIINLGMIYKNFLN